MFMHFLLICFFFCLFNQYISPFFLVLIMCIAACFRLLKPYMVFQHLNWRCGCTCSVLRCILIFALLIYWEPIGEAYDILICSSIICYLSGCKWLWSRTCGLWIFHSGIHPVWRRNFSKLIVPLGVILFLFMIIIIILGERGLMVLGNPWSLLSNRLIFTEECSLFVGFQSTSDSNASHNRDSPEDACIWCRKQGYVNTQGYRGNDLTFQLFRRLSKPGSKEAIFLAVFCKALKEAWSVQSRLCMLTSLLGWWSG